MAKQLDSYTGSVRLTAGIIQDGGNFPLVEAHAVLVDEDDTRLDDKLNGLVERFEQVPTKVSQLENDSKYVTLPEHSSDLDDVNVELQDIQNRLTSCENNKADSVHSHVYAGEKVTGKQFDISGSQTAAKDGAEIFNNYMNNKAIGNYSHAEGQFSTVINNYGHAEGYSTTAGALGVAGGASHAEGYKTSATHEGSHSEGKQTTATGIACHAEGYRTTAGGGTQGGHYAHAEGLDTAASGISSHAEGEACTVSAKNGHAEGYKCTVSATAGHAEGSQTTVDTSGQYAHAEGQSTRANGSGAHAEGYGTNAFGEYSHAAGYCTSAQDYQYVIGHYNKGAGTAGTSSGTGDGYAFIIGNGTDSSSGRSNAFLVNFSGQVYYAGSGTPTGADYAEYFEWQDGNPNAEDRRGYFVTLDEDKIKIAEPGDYILGIVSGQPSIIGNGDIDWHGRYMLDEFGAYIYEDFKYEEEVPKEVQEELIDKETGESIIKTKIVMEKVTRIGRTYKINPEYDPERPYIHRADRPEWDAVGMLGVVSVRDDGTCKVNGFCTVAKGGIATKADTGYRVIKRVTNNIIKIVLS
jgi:hypothetical protein